MKLQDFRGAADDGDEALKYLKATDAATGLNDETRALRRRSHGRCWKTVLRLARALQAMQRMSEAMRLLHHERRNYPECPELQRLAEATRLALRSWDPKDGMTWEAMGSLGRGTPSQSRSGREELGMDSQDGRKLMEYIAFIAESLQHEISNMKGSPTLPAAFMALLSKLEYILLKADEAQWKMNMEGKFVDLYKLPGVILLEVVSMTLEQKMLKDRELERGAYEAAFNAGQGLETMMPLIQAPPAFAEHALRCLATMAQTYLENVEHLISLGVLQLLGAQGDLTETLASLPVARRYAARLLMQCTASKDRGCFWEILGGLLIAGRKHCNRKCKKIPGKQIHCQESQWRGQPVSFCNPGDGLWRNLDDHSVLICFGCSPDHPATPSTYLGLDL
eukprot:Skav227327  [mRNA]  locus=scaffold2964:48742:55904:- [translate_table: standard]